jgi:hypothetical protein
MLSVNLTQTKEQLITAVLETMRGDFQQLASKYPRVRTVRVVNYPEPIVGSSPNSVYDQRQSQL